MAESETSISGALSFAWSLLSHHWRAIWGVLALNALSWTVMFAGMFADRSEIIGVGFGAMLATTFPLCGSIYRLGAVTQGRENPELKLGALGLQWGRMELRILSATVLLFVFFAILLVLMSIALSAPLMGIVMNKGIPLEQVKTPEQLQRALGPQVTQVAAIIQLVILAVLGWVGARLMLAPAASALSGRVAVLRTWKLTKGAGWRLFVCCCLVYAPICLTVMLAAAGVNGELSSFTPAQILAYSVLSGMLAGAASTPLSAGVQVYFYKALVLAAAPKPDDGASRP